jgi:pyrroline-5-carboxylate reductase
VKGVVFLGGGRITAALVAGLRLAGYERPIMVHDRHPHKLAALKRQHKVIAEPDLHRAVEAAHSLIIAVRPDSAAALLRKVREQRIRGSLVAVSLAAGIPLSALHASLGPPVRWARAMPSPVCRTRQGLTALAFGRGLTSSNRAELRAFFALVGQVLEVPENQFNAFTVTFSSSHGHHALATLVDAAVANGLNRHTAQIAAAHALADSICSWRAGNFSLERLLHEAATPGGTAAAVISALDAAGYQSIMRNGLRAGIQRAQKNSRLFR